MPLSLPPTATFALRGRMERDDADGGVELVNILALRGRQERTGSDSGGLKLSFAASSGGEVPEDPFATQMSSAAPSFAVGVEKHRRRGAQDPRTFRVQLGDGNCVSVLPEYAGP